MSKPNHTPGPWRLTKITGHSRQWVMGESGCVALIESAVGQHMSFAEEAANAQLIAAAPELLEALEEVLANWTPVQPNYTEKGFSDSISRMQAVVAKARGEG